MTEPPEIAAFEEAELRAEVERLRLLHRISQDFNSSLDFDALLPRVFDAVLSAVGAQGGSLWIAEGDELRCRLALGASSRKLVGTAMPLGAGFVGDVARKQRTTIVTDAMRDPRFEQRVDRSSQMIATTIMATPMVAKGITVGSIQVVNKVGGDGIFDQQDRELLEGLAASAAVALRNAQLHAAERRARDLALLLEISHEITATLDLDRVLQSVVNLAARALVFDRGAVVLLANRRWEVRAIAGQESVDAKSPPVRRLAERAMWAGTRGEAYYLPDREAAGSETDAAFVSAFGSDLAEEELRSGLYLPLKDEEGLLGVLLFEARAPDFAQATQREVAEILANQTTVALRNAQLYHQVPMADTWGALAARKRAFLALPRRRKQAWLAAAVLVLAAATLIRWPLRVGGSHPVFRASALLPVRTPVPGVIEQVAVREGERVARGTMLAQLRDIDLQAQRQERAGEALAADRAAALAASRADAAEERLQRSRADGLHQEVSLLDQQIAASTVRAPSSGLVLTARPEERIGLRLAAGDPVVTVGRTDTLLLEFGVQQRDLDRVQAGQEVRLRVDALPQHTFTGRVTQIGVLPLDTLPEVLFPVRAAIPNPAGLLRPGMAAHARVLTGSMSAAGRLLRGPARWLRLFWWRVRP